MPAPLPPPPGGAVTRAIRAIRGARLVRRSLRRPLLRVLAPASLAVLMLAGTLAAALDLPGLRRLLAESGPLPAALGALAAPGAWALVHQSGLRAVLFGPAPLGWLARQPLGPAAWSLGLAGPLASAAGPVVLAGALQHPEAPLAGMALWAATGATAALAAGAAGRRGAPAVWAAAALLAGASGAATLQPALAPLALGPALVAVAGLGPAWAALRRQPPRPARLWSPRPRGVLTVFLGRERVFLARRRPAAALGLGLGGPLLGGLLRAAQAPGGLLAPGGAGAARVGVAAALLLRPATAGATVLLAAHARASPASWDPPAWPVSPAQRAGAGALAALLLARPAALGLAVAGGPPVVAPLTGALLASAAASPWLCGRARSAPLDLGTAVGIGILAALHPALGLGLVPLGLALARRQIATGRRPHTRPERP